MQQIKHVIGISQRTKKRTDKERKGKIFCNSLCQTLLLNLYVQPCLEKSQHNHILGRLSLMCEHVVRDPFPDKKEKMFSFHAKKRKTKKVSEQIQ